MKVLHVCKSEMSGGAARAANRIHKSLLEAGIQSEMIVQSKQSDDSTVKIGGSKLDIFFTNIKSSLASKLIQATSRQSGSHSLSIFPSYLVKLINKSDADIVHLHWIQGEMLSIKDISKISKPLVWTLHDMWPMAGSAHYYPIWNNDIKKNEPEKSCISRYLFKQKLKLWKPNKIMFLANSSWMLKQAQKNKIINKHSVRLVHYPLDHGIWRPIEKKIARNILNLKGNNKYILFGAIGGDRDHRKGFKELMKSIEILSSTGDLENITLLVFGTSEISINNNINCNIKCFGHLYDDYSMRLLYSSADVFVAPSLQEAFGQTASEAQACGTPVVSFNNSGLEDTVEHLKTGYCAELGDPSDLAEGIKFVINSNDHESLSTEARKKTLNKYSSNIIAQKYIDCYQELIND